MVRISRKRIVEDEFLFSDQEIQQINFNEAFIINNLSEQEQQIIFLAKMKLIKNKMKCDKCLTGTEMSLTSKKNKNDGFMWYCVNGCKSLKSVRSESFF
jgi:late competence protein required for DNA uptake (superfamily II DNA/RNA helicase)